MLLSAPKPTSRAASRTTSRSNSTPFAHQKYFYLEVPRRQFDYMKHVNEDLTRSLRASHPGQFTDRKIMEKLTACQLTKQYEIPDKCQVDTLFKNFGPSRRGTAGLVVGESALMATVKKLRLRFSAEFIERIGNLFRAKDEVWLNSEQYYHYVYILQNAKQNDMKLALFLKMDDNRDGKISEDQFLYIVQKLQINMSKSRIKALFDFYQGEISFEEYFQCCQRFRMQQMSSTMM